MFGSSCSHKKRENPPTLECTSFKNKITPSSNEKLQFTTQHQKNSKKMMIGLTCMLKLEATCFTRIRVHVRDFFENVLKTPRKQQRKNNHR
jgi:hypothetical protein